MIDHQLPNDWKDLQGKVGSILGQAGFNVEIEKRVETVRGKVEIDVFAIDRTQTPEIVYLCECKHWNTNIPQSQVHAFRTVVADYGGNVGLFISKAGFQQGGYEAAQKTNIRLVDWFEFQELFKEKWLNNFAEYLYELTIPLVDYSEPINSAIDRRARRLSREEHARFIDLKQKYFPFAQFGGMLKILPEMRRIDRDIVDFPIDVAALGFQSNPINSYLELGDFYAKEVSKALARFDDLFGEEIRLDFNKTNVSELFTS